MKRNYFVVFIIVAAAIFTSCGKLPQAEIDAAKASLDSAKIAQADIYLADEFFALQDSLNACVVAAETGKSNMFANYSEAKAKLAAITMQGKELVAKTETRKEEIKGELVSAQAEISNILSENNQLLQVAPAGKEDKEALEAIRADIESINNSITDVPVLIENGELINAQTKVKAAQEKAATINTELKTVLEKYMKKG